AVDTFGRNTSAGRNHRNAAQESSVVAASAARGSLLGNAAAFGRADADEVGLSGGWGRVQLRFEWEDCGRDAFLKRGRTSGRWGRRTRGGRGALYLASGASETAVVCNGARLLGAGIFGCGDARGG